MSDQDSKNTTTMPMASDFPRRLTQSIIELGDQPTFTASLLSLMHEATKASGFALLIPKDKSMAVAISKHLDRNAFEELLQTNDRLRSTLLETLTTHRQHCMPMPFPVANAASQAGSFSNESNSEEASADNQTTAEERTGSGSTHAIFTPLGSGDGVYAIAATFHEPLSSDEINNHCALLQLFADRGEAWFDKRRVVATERRCKGLQGLHETSARISQNIEQQRFAFDLVNELRQFLKCDRVAYFTSSSGKCKPIAFSNQPIFDSRSNSVRRLRRLVGRILASKSSFWSDDQETDELVPEIEQALDAYREEAKVCSIAVLPLIHSSPQMNPRDRDLLVEMVNGDNPNDEQVIGAVVVEQFKTELVKPEIESAWQQVQSSVLNAALNSRRHHNIFLMPFWLRVGQFCQFYVGSTQKKAIAITALILGCLVALVAIPAEHAIRCEGVLRPKVMQHVFAQEQGAVEDILVEDGSYVEAGDLLLRQRNFELEERRAELDGEQKRLEAQVQSLLARLVSARLGQEAGDEDSAAISAELSEKQAELAKTREMGKLASSRLESLNIRASFSGVIFAWNARRRLGERPVAPGDKLFSVGRVDGPWELDLKVPDRRAGYVTRAWRASLEAETPLQITYVHTTDPTKHYQASIAHVPENLEIGSNQEAVLPAKGSLPQDNIRFAKPGTPVVAKIHCGSVSLGYAKLYEFYDWAKRMWFTYVY